MKVLAILSLFALGALSATDDHDGVIYDIFDAKAILENPEETKKAVDCIMLRAPCGKYEPMKEKSPRILKNKCANCTPEQRALHEESLAIFKEKYNDYYNEVMARFA